MAHNPLVTIVTPSYNQGPYIEATIQSVLSQDYPNIEHLVFDGGSTDETVDILRRYSDQLWWVSEPDRGQSDAINKGFKRAKGEIVAWLNSDDVYLPGAVSESVAFLAANPDVDLVYGDAQLIDEHGKIIREQVLSKPFSIATILTEFSTLAQPSAFFRRDAVEAVGYLDESLRYMMDFELWIRLGLHGQGVYLPGPRAQMRFHSTSKTIAEQSPFWPERKRVLDRLFGEHGPELPVEVHAAREGAYAHCMLYWADFLIREGKRAEARPQLWYALQRHPRMRRRALAGALLLDSYLGTSFASAGRAARDAVFGSPQP